MSDKALILVVDDDSDWQDIVIEIFHKMGYRTHASPNVAKAKAWLASNRPDLVLLDIMMPDDNGLDLCRWIRSQEKFSRVPIIIDSGLHDDETTELALELGAVNFLHKPIQLKDLQERVKRLLVSET